MPIVELRVPDLGNFADVPVIDVLVKSGDEIAVDTPLVTLETDKASMDVPATAAGRITEVLVRKGDTVSTGSVLARVETAAESASVAATAPDVGAVAAAVAGDDRAAPYDLETDLLVLGAGPGGYTAAFRAADLGLRVTLVDSAAALGGVCLHVGCIPSKALLHAAKVIADAAAMAAHGIDFGRPRIDLDQLRAWKAGVVGQLAGGLARLAKQRNVTVLQGVGRFAGPHRLEVEQPDRRLRVRFAQCIVAVGSEPIRLPFAPDDPRIVDSTGALELRDIPSRLLVIGGGIIGLEMACVYAALGSRVSVVELTAQLMPGTDPDLLRPLQQRIRSQYDAVLLGTKVTAIEPADAGLKVTFDGPQAPPPAWFDRVLVAVGRRPNGLKIAAERAGLAVDARGFIAVDRQQRTNVAHIFAIGDVVGQPMLAHKASHEGKVAAEVAAGHKAAFDARVIPSVAYTDPEIAWVGLTETEANARGIAVQKGVFPWAASGRALSMGRADGFTKLLFDPATQRVLGGAMVGPHAGELIAEVALAIEMGADAADIGLTVHPHPTLTETTAFAAEACAGTLTDLYLPKKS